MHGDGVGGDLSDTVINVKAGVIHLPRPGIEAFCSYTYRLPEPLSV